MTKLAMGGVEIPTWSRALIVLKGVTKEAPPSHKCLVTALKSVLNSTLPHPCEGFYFWEIFPQKGTILVQKLTAVFSCPTLQCTAVLHLLNSEHYTAPERSSMSPCE